jgi:ethanolamine transporter
MDIINSVILWIMMAFMLVAALDRVFDQFGGSEAVLGKIGLGSLGQKVEGAGKHDIVRGEFLPEKFPHAGERA